MDLNLDTSIATNKKRNGKQWRFSCYGSLCAVSSGSTLFTKVSESPYDKTNKMACARSED